MKEEIDENKEKEVIQKAYHYNKFLVIWFIAVFIILVLRITKIRVEFYSKEASLGLGATRWQTIWRVLLRAATPGILTAVIFGMARAFGEALAIQMVVGNAVMMPKDLISPASTLTSILTSGIPNATPGIQLNALWSLALLLLIMSLFFNLAMRAIAKKGSLK